MNHHCDHDLEQISFYAGTGGGGGAGAYHSLNKKLSSSVGHLVYLDHVTLEK